MNYHCVLWNFKDKQLASFAVIVVFISVFFVVVEVWTCVEWCVVFSSDTGLDDALVYAYVCRRQ